MYDKIPRMYKVAPETNNVSRTRTLARSIHAVIRNVISISQLLRNARIEFLKLIARE
jgi:hypothetical protein